MSQQHDSYLCCKLAKETQSLLEAEVLFLKTIYESCDRENDSLKAKIEDLKKELDQARNEAVEYKRSHKELLKQLNTANKNEETWRINFIKSIDNAFETQALNNDLRRSIQTLMRKFEEHGCVAHYCNMGHIMWNQEVQADEESPASAAFAASIERTVPEAMDFDTEEE